MLVVVDGNQKKSKVAAQAIVDTAWTYGLDARFLSTEDAEPGDVASAESLIVGCAARVDTPFGGQDARSMASWMQDLPPLGGKPVAVFCSYAFFPHTFADVTTRTAEVLDGLEQAVQAKGGTLVASEAILNRKLGEGITSLLAPFVPGDEP